MKKSGYVYSGAGGAIGFLRGASYELQKKFQATSIVGVSSGAIVGLMHALGLNDRLDDLLFTITDRDIRKKRTVRYAFRKVKHLVGVRTPIMGYFDNTPLRKLLRKTIIDSFVQVPFASVSVNYRTGKTHYFRLHRHTFIGDQNVDSVVSHIIASTAIPVVFPLEKIGDDYYMDGGVETHTPIEPMKELFPTSEHICIITTANMESKNLSNPKSDIEVAGNIIGSLIGNVAERDFMKFELRNQLAGCNGDYTYYPSKVVRPNKTLAPTTRFHHSFMRDDFNHGRKQATL